MARYKRRDDYVDAHKWDGFMFGVVPQWLTNAEYSGRVWLAASGGGVLCVRVGDGALQAKPGDWIVRGSYGDLTVMSDAEFAREYQAVPEPCADATASINNAYRKQLEYMVRRYGVAGVVAAIATTIERERLSGKDTP